MAADVNIANLALSLLGIGKNISNIINDTSNEARSCREFFDLSRDELLEKFPWPFARRFTDLALVEEDPTVEWGFSYRFPADCLAPRRILSSLRQDTHESKIRFIEGSDSAGRLIYTSQPDATLEYTYRADDPTMYPKAFKAALSMRLAAYVAPRITGGDQFKRGQFIEGLFRLSISEAMAATTTGGEVPDLAPRSTLETARD